MHISNLTIFYSLSNPLPDQCLFPHIHPSSIHNAHFQCQFLKIKSSKSSTFTHLNSQIIHSEILANLWDFPVIKQGSEVLCCADLKLVFWEWCGVAQIRFLTLLLPNFLCFYISVKQINLKVRVYSEHKGKGGKNRQEHKSKTRVILCGCMCVCKSERKEKRESALNKQTKKLLPLLAISFHSKSYIIAVLGPSGFLCH